MKNKFFSINTRIAREIQFLLEDEGILPGERLPSERSLSEQFGVQRQTVRKALALLEQKGLITTKSRSGRFMATPRISVNLKGAIDPESFLDKEDTKIQRDLLCFETGFAPQNLIYKMHIPEGSKILTILIIVSLNGKKLWADRAFIQPGQAPGLDKEVLADQSRYTLFKAAYMDQKMQIVSPAPLERDLLKIGPDGKLMKITGFTFNALGRCIEYFERLMIPEHFIFYC